MFLICDFIRVIINTYYKLFYKISKLNANKITKKNKKYFFSIYSFNKILLIDKRCIFQSFSQIFHLRI